MKPSTLPILLAVSVLLATGALSAQERVTFRAAPAEGPVHVDGVLDDPVWRRAQAVSLPFEVAQGDNAPAPVSTSCLVAASTTDIYFACAAEDPEPGTIRAVMGKRDDVDGHDRITLVLDPFDDGRRGFGFTVTALGVQADAQYDFAGVPDPAWDAIWESAGRLTDRGYVVEARIPFRSLRYPDGQSPRWGAHFQRSWPRGAPARTLSMRWDRAQSCFLCQANYVVGFSPRRSGPNVDVRPTITTTRTDTRPEGTGSWNTGSSRPDLGLDLRWGPSPNMSLDFTVNPDFSQVESDAVQLDVNNRFALFFPELRPFFLENADLFSTPLRTVFTRSISDPTLGAKFTGKSGAHAGGVLVVRDARNDLLLPGAERSETVSLGAPVTTLVGRYQRDLGASSMGGVLITGRQGEGYHNAVASVDGTFTPFGAVTVRAQAARSWSGLDALADALAPSERDIGGSAFKVNVAIRNRAWELVGEGQRIDAGFRSDVGFLTQVDRMGGMIRGNHILWAGEDTNWFTRWVFGGGIIYDEDLSGDLVGAIHFANFTYLGPLQTQVGATFRRRRTRIAGTVFNRDDVWSAWAIRPTGGVGLTVVTIVGKEVDLLGLRPARNLQMEPQLDFRLGRHVSGTAALRYQRLRVDRSNALEARFWEVRMAVNPSARQRLRFVAQLRDTYRDPSLYQTPVRRRQVGLFSQLLYSYQVDARTVLHVGYTDDRRGWEDGDRPALGLAPVGRTFFVKGGIAWRP